MTDGDLDPVIHAPVRLRITVTLSTLREGDYLSFSRLQQLLDLTPGNLITHLRKLEDAGYVSVQKRFVDRKPQTRYALSNRGREALLDYVAHLENLLPAPRSGRGRKG